jgi:hypothetical protein
MVQPDGKILAAGRSDLNGNPTQFGLVRLNPDGSPDTAEILAAGGSAGDSQLQDEEHLAAVDSVIEESSEGPAELWLSASLAEEFDSIASRKRRR